MPDQVFINPEPWSQTIQNRPDLRSVTLSEQRDRQIGSQRILHDFAPFRIASSVGRTALQNSATVVCRISNSPTRGT